MAGHWLTYVITSSLRTHLETGSAMFADAARAGTTLSHFAEGVGRRFEHVLLDEYQNSNHFNQGSCSKLKRDGARLTIVGDDAQSLRSNAGTGLIGFLADRELTKYWRGPVRRTTFVLLTSLPFSAAFHSSALHDPLGI